MRRSSSLAKVIFICQAEYAMVAGIATNVAKAVMELMIYLYTLVRSQLTIGVTSYKRPSSVLESFIAFL